MTRGGKGGSCSQTYPSRLPRKTSSTTLRSRPKQGRQGTARAGGSLGGASRESSLEESHLERVDYDVDVLDHRRRRRGLLRRQSRPTTRARRCMMVTKLRMGDANTMMAEGGIQAADKPNDSPAQPFSGRLRRRTLRGAEGPSLQAGHRSAGGHPVAHPTLA